MKNIIPGFTYGKAGNIFFEKKLTDLTIWAIPILSVIKQLSDKKYAFDLILRIRYYWLKLRRYKFIVPKGKLVIVPTRFLF